ncbi:MAG: AAA family ATPase [Thaumarchaeota archaeon]|nr:AAA family ATPase [Nitrososphaerota archaeon]
MSFGNSEQTIDFSEFNTIVGPNDTGKTNIFRAINLIHLLLNERVTPSESYYHNKNFEKPFHIELKIKLNKEEKNAIRNYFISTCLNREFSGTNEVKMRSEKIIETIMSKYSHKLFDELYEEITIVVTTSRVNHPPDIFLKIHKNDKIINCDYGDFGKNRPAKRGGYSLSALAQVILTDIANSFSVINNIIEHGKGKIPKLDEWEFSLFDYIYDNTNAKNFVSVGGFRFDDYESRHENNNSFLRLREFVEKIVPDQESVSFQTLIGLILRNSIVRTIDIRSRPKSILNPRDLEYQNEMISISGENIVKILMSMQHSKNPDIKSCYQTIQKNFKILTKNIELEITLEPKISKTQSKELMEYSDDSTYIDNRQTLGTLTKEKETINQEFGIQLVKNKIPIPLEFASSGTMELISLLTALIGQKNKVILLDEPALNLHSILQRRVLQLIQEAVTKNNNQVIMITHSPYLVNPEKIRNLWKFSPSKSGTKVINVNQALGDFNENDQKKTIQRLHNSEVRAILFQHGVIFVEGPSDKMVLEKIDRHMTDNNLKGPNIEEHEWMVLDVGGKDSMPLFINMAKRLKLPHTSIMDFDSLMQCTRRIKLEKDDVRTSSIIGYIEKTDGLSKQEQNLIKKLENKIIKTQKKNNENRIQFWYPDEALKQLNKITLAHNMYVLTKDLENAIRIIATPRDSKPLKALEQINDLLSQNKIPSELKNTMKFIKTKIKTRK